MIIKLHSENPQLSYVINKNPSSPPRVTSIRQGYLFGWYHNNDYVMRFIDGADELSFKDYKNQFYEYLAPSRFVHPEIPLNIFDELFRTLDKKQDTFSKQTIEIHHLRIKNKTLTTLKKYSDNIELEFIPCKHWDRYYTIKISLQGTVRDLIDYTSLFCMLICLDNREFMDLSDERAVKFFKMLGRFDCSYFIRYLFKTNIIKNSNKKYEKLKDYLNESISTEYKIDQLNNFESRVRFIKQYINTNNLLDIGCGEGRYLTRFAGQVKKYIGIDIDEKCIDSCLDKCKKRGIENAVFYPTLEDFLKSEHGQDEYTIIASEVIEHIEEDKEFLLSVVTNLVWNKIILTTPNKDFNQHYRIDSRHEDHVREYTHDELCNLLISLNNLNSVYEIHGIGDSVNDIQPTFGIIITQKD